MKPTSVAGQGTGMLPAVQGSPPCMLVSNLEPRAVRVKKGESTFACEAEIDRNLERLTQSVANKVLLGTSPRPGKR